MMPSDPNNSQSRLDRLERMHDLIISDHATFAENHRKFEERHREFMEQQQRLASEHNEFREEVEHDIKILLTAQVLLTDNLDKLTDRVNKLTESQSATDERLNALIGVVDGVIRKNPPPPPQ